MCQKTDGGDIFIRIGGQGSGDKTLVVQFDVLHAHIGQFFFQYACQVPLIFGGWGLIGYLIIRAGVDGDVA